MSSTTTAGGDNNPARPRLLDLPREIIEKILVEVAKVNYRSLYDLAVTCHEMKDLCSEFIKRRPRSEFTQPRPAGLSDSEDESEEQWNYDGSDDDRFERDDLDEINEALEQFSYGSNYDEDLDDLLHGGGGGDDYYDEPQDRAAPAGEFNIDENVVDGW
jgi:hypothetical protein